MISTSKILEIFSQGRDDDPEGLRTSQLASVAVPRHVLQSAECLPNFLSQVSALRSHSARSVAFPCTPRGREDGFLDCEVRGGGAFIGVMDTTSSLIYW
jgi:hypothetical protein